MASGQEVWGRRVLEWGGMAREPSRREGNKKGEDSRQGEAAGLQRRQKSSSSSS